MPTECNPCKRMLALFKGRPRAQQLSQPPKPTLLRRAFGRMKSNRRRRRHRASSFSSVRAVFWPLMSMGSDVDRSFVADRPPRSSSDDSGGAAVRAPSPSLDTPGAASTTAARLLAIQAQISKAAASASPAKRDSTASGAVRAPPPSLDEQAALATTAARVLALQARLGSAAVFASPTKPITTAVHRLSDVAAACGDGDVEEACKGFERHLMEMLVEEAKVGDLMDVEELLGCWEKLRSPVFVRLVGRFYGDLCMDLFSDLDDDASSESSDESTV
uniref:OVATE domain-containing protein n=1 Tax=Hordeum vulgare subsp. vulgare TaxID=112509 RepID=A0A8I6X1Y2_HORVV